MNPYVELARPLNAAIAAFSALLGALVVLGGDLLDAAYLAPVALGMAMAFLVTAGGNALNDYMDADVDTAAHPGRPIPSGRLSKPQVLWFAIGCLVAAQPLAGAVVSLGSGGAVLSLDRPGLFPILVELLALGCLFTYELSLKARGLSGNLMVSLLSALTLLFGAACVVGPSDPGLRTVVVLFALAFFASAGREVTKDIEDVEADRGARVTLPMTAGRGRASSVAAALIIAAVALSPAPFWPLGAMGWPYVAVVLVADVVFLYSLMVLPSSPGRAQRVHKAGMMLALLAFLAGSVAGGFG
jgi:geranylgeranylglycerol-phosphate geranylgeranyltransferase